MKFFTPPSEFTSMNPFTLRFKENSLESLYSRGYAERFIRSNRLSLVISLFLYVTYSLIDLLFFTKHVPELTLIRFGITIPLGLAVLVFSYIQKPITCGTNIFSILIIIAGVSISYVFIYEYNIVFSASLLGLIVFHIYAFNLIRITFLRSAIIVLSLFVVSIISISFVHHSMYSLLVLFFLTISMFFSAYAGYFFELTDRINFLAQYELLQKNEAYHRLQKELENIVDERTQQLQVTNIELQHAKQKAEESNALKTKFLSTISHEIRTPLTSILGFSQLITKTKELEKQEKYVAVIEQSIENLLQIITNILTLAEIESNRLESSTTHIQRAEFIQEVEAIAQSLIKKHSSNLPFTIQYEEFSERTISIGKSDLQTVLQHLFDNAIKYTPTGEFGFSCKIKNNTEFECCVYDSGIGIPENQVSVIFDYFRQVQQDDTRTYSGIGVGLSICKGLILNAKGRIWVESTIGKGTKLFFTVPIILPKK